MDRWWTQGARGRIVSGLDSMMCDRAGMKVEVALGRQGNMGTGNIEWASGRRPEALGRGKIVPDEYTTPVTLLGTHRTRYLQQDDCNGPISFQKAMNPVIKDKLGIDVFVYINDIFIYNNTTKEHDEHV